MNTQKIEELKQKLLKEEQTLIEELRTVAVSTSNDSSFEPIKPHMDIDLADRNEVADEIEEFGNNTAIANDLEIRLKEVRLALSKIENGGYGICEISNAEIEEDRLDANPAARTCKAHINEHLN